MAEDAVPDPPPTDVVPLLDRPAPGAEPGAAVGAALISPLAGAGLPAFPAAGELVPAAGFVVCETPAVLSDG